ncbi:MAG: 50S ribosomal protein L9 [Candidatus Hydrogenedentes bacterium]|nr:50S ribosomal protein L9 [Candidatus Hydrogenedentota bacterium]
MKVILREDVEHVGVMGDTVKVANGYARNFLLPQQLAVVADSASAKQIKHELDIIRRRDEKRKAELAKVAKSLEGVSLEIKMRAGEGDKLFGSVTNGHIADKLAEKGFAINRKQINLPEPIKQLGIFTVSVKLGGGIEGSVKVWVTGEHDEVTTSTAAATASAEVPEAAV